jgi:hypothetical protein
VRRLGVFGVLDDRVGDRGPVRFEYSRLLGGGQRRFDEDATRRMVRRDVERARNFSALKNHEAIADDGVSRPALSSTWFSITDFASVQSVAAVEAKARNSEVGGGSVQSALSAGEVLISTSVRTRSAKSIANSCANAPPAETPTTCAFPIPSASSTPAASATRLPPW